MPRGRLKQFDVTKLVKLTNEQLTAIQAFAERHDLPNDSEAIRQLIARGLEADAKAEGQTPKRR